MTTRDSDRPATFLALASCAAAAFLAIAGATDSARADVPPRPEDIQFAPLAFTPPDASTFRHVLSDGTIVYLAPSHEFPLINLTMSFKGGAYLEPADAVGLAGMTGAMMRAGGTTSIEPAELDEQLDFLATRLNVSCGDTMSSASLNCLSRNFDESLHLLMDVLRNPGFDAERFAIQKANALEQLKQRNDSADEILGREWAALMYGSDHFEARQMTQATLDAITADRMREFQRRIFRPDNMIVAVSGDFEPAEMLSKLEHAFAGWEKGEPIPDPPAPTAQLKPGVYHAAKDIPQGKVFIGLRGITRDDPDYFPLLVMNDILGGGGFTSRIVTSVRSNEGLAYSAGSSLDTPVWYPGEIRALFQSKNATVPLAIKLIDDEFTRMRSEPVSDAELELAKNSFIETFPQNFANRDAMLRIFVSDEWTGRPEGYWKSFRDKVRAVTPQDVQRVAGKYLDPDKMAILVVGDWDEIYEGNDRASMRDIDSGKVEHLPARDPLTLEPVR